MTTTEQTIQAKAIEIGKLAVRATTSAGSGHPMTALSLAHLTAVLMYQGHCQLVGLRSRWRAIRTLSPWLRPSGDAGDLGPNLKGLGPGSSILGGGHLMAAEVEEVVDPVMGGEEALCLAC